SDLWPCSILVNQRLTSASEGLLAQPSPPALNRVESFDFHTIRRESLMQSGWRSASGRPSPLYACPPYGSYTNIPDILNQHNQICGEMQLSLYESIAIVDLRHHAAPLQPSSMLLPPGRWLRQEKRRATKQSCYCGPRSGANPMSPDQLGHQYRGNSGP